MKAQIGVETLIVFTILIILLAFSFTSYVNKNSEINTAREYLEARKICQSVQIAVNQLSVSSYGSSFQLTIPTKLQTIDYKLDVYPSDKVVVVSWKNFSSSCLLSVQNVTNSSSFVFNSFAISKGENSVYVDGDGSVVIKKI